jgi:hypothetical protein
MDARKIKLPLGDIQAVREVADKFNATPGLVPRGLTKALFTDAVDTNNSNMYWTNKRNKKYTSGKE